MVSIPDVLEFSHHYLSQINRTVHPGGLTALQACQAQSPSHSSPILPILPDGVTMSLDNPCDDSLFFDTAEAGCDEIVRCPEKLGRR